MLHGRSQVNIAPRCKRPVQYAETDRPNRRRCWHDRRDERAVCRVFSYTGNHFARGNRSVRRYPPRFSATKP
ncbi:MAG TPA: hypothetical protein DCE25_03570 [Pseudomonas sp.]|nr:hypothetical protein [Pseudomonas sp.]